MIDPSPRTRGAQRKLASTVIISAVVIVAALIIAALLTFLAHQTGGLPNGGPNQGRARGPGSGSGGGRPPVTVGVSAVSLGSIPIRISALGTVTPVTSVNVNARVAGMLDTVNFHEGEMVREGQSLAQIDPRPYAIAVEQAEAQIAKDQALLADAQLDLARFRLLKGQDSIAAQQVDTQSAIVRQDEAVISADRAAVANAKLNLSFTHITAPVSGRVGLRQIDRGNQITANSATPIVVVTQVDPINVVFSLPEDDIPAIVHRANGGKGISVSVLDRSGGSVLAQGALTTLDNVIDTATGTIKAKAQFANRTGALYANQFVNVSLLVDTLENQIVVPTTAIRHGPQGDFVWVLQVDHTVKVRPVVVGPGTAETVSITSGLKVGESVVTDGGDRLRDGAHVVLPGAGPPFGIGATGHHHWRGGGAPAGG